MPPAYKPPQPTLPPREPPPPRVFLQLDKARGAPYTAREYAGKLAWRVVQRTLFRWFRPRGRAWLLALFGGDVHPSVDVRGTVRVHHPWLLRIGRNSSLGENVSVYNLGPVVIGEHTAVSQNVHLCAGTHDWRTPSMPLVRAGITIGSGTWVCADAFVGPGVRVGHNAVVAARAVVVKDVPDGVIVGGNPARTLGPRETPGMVLAAAPGGTGTGRPGEAGPAGGQGADACVSAS